MNPFIVLGLPYSATDEPIRQAYLQLLRENPSDTPGSLYGEILEAYNMIKTETDRHNWFLNNKSYAHLNPSETFLSWARHAKLSPPTLQNFQSHLQKILNA